MELISPRPSQAKRRRVRRKYLRARFWTKKGTGNNFDGTYSLNYLKKLYKEWCREYDEEQYIKSEIYTVKDNADLLCAVPENGG